MRVSAIVSFLVFVAIPASLFAQGGGGQGGGGSTSLDVVNVSQQIATQGGFVGSGRPEAFVGVNDDPASAGSRRSASVARRPTTPARPTIRPTAQRAMRATPTAFRGANNQFVSALTSVDFDFEKPTAQHLPATVDSYLSRIQGIQDSQVTFRDSPTGTTVVLTGTVASDRQRRVAEQFLLLEPGVNRVENFLEVR